jgi:hypothetical protein
MNLSTVRCFVGAAVLLGTACGGEENGTGPLFEAATVEFVYQAPTTIDPNVAAAEPQCVNGVGRTHIHPSWRNFSRIDMTAVVADRWEITFTDVPPDQLMSIRVSDPNVCADNPTGASTQNVFANAVLLVNIVDTPGSGIEPGLSFTVDVEGSVTP